MDSSQLELQLLRDMVSCANNVTSCDWSRSYSQGTSHEARMKDLKSAVEEVRRFQQLQDMVERLARVRGM